jgi:apolipoprotein N-acyltransferase
MRPLFSYALAALFGALTPLGFAPVGWFPLPILTLAGLFWLARSVTPGQAFRLGFAFGLGLLLVGVSWIYVSISTYGGMPAALAALATLLFCAFVALLPALSLLLAARLSAAGQIRIAFALPAAWALLEWTRGWLFTGFPWLALGYSQAPSSPLAGYAPLLGVYGVGLLAALSAAALVLARERPKVSTRLSRRTLARRLGSAADRLDAADGRTAAGGAGAGQHRAGHEIPPGKAGFDAAPLRPCRAGQRGEADRAAGNRLALVPFRHSAGLPGPAG